MDLSNVQRSDAAIYEAIMLKNNANKQTLN